MEAYGEVLKRVQGTCPTPATACKVSAPLWLRPSLRLDDPRSSRRSSVAVRRTVLGLILGILISPAVMAQEAPPADQPVEESVTETETRLRRLRWRRPLTLRRLWSNSPEF